MFNVIKVKLNYMDEATGVVKMPTVSWQMESDERNCYQSAYEIQVAEDAIFSRILYDSGLTESNASAGLSFLSESALFRQKLQLWISLFCNTGLDYILSHCYGHNSCSQKQNCR